MQKKEIELDISEITVESHAEAGKVIIFKCPDCYSEVRYCKGAWWSAKCSCGLTWSVKIKILACGKKA